MVIFEQKFQFCHSVKIRKQKGTASLSKKKKDLELMMVLPHDLQ